MEILKRIEHWWKCRRLITEIGCNFVAKSSSGYTLSWQKWSQDWTAVNETFESDGWGNNKRKALEKIMNSEIVNKGHRKIMLKLLKQIQRKKVYENAGEIFMSKDVSQITRENLNCNTKPLSYNEWKKINGGKKNDKSKRNKNN